MKNTRNWISKTDKAARDCEWNPGPEPIPLRPPGFLRSFHAQGCKILPQYFLGGLSLVIRNTLISQNLETSKFWNRKIFKALYQITQIAGRQQSQSQNPLLSLLQVPIMTKNTTQNHIILKTGIQPSSCNMTLFLTYPGPVLYQLWLPQIALASFLARWLVSLQRFFLKKKIHLYHFSFSFKL